MKTIEIEIEDEIKIFEIKTCLEDLAVSEYLEISKAFFEKEILKKSANAGFSTIEEEVEFGKESEEFKANKILNCLSILLRPFSKKFFKNYPELISIFESFIDWNSIFSVQKQEAPKDILIESLNLHLSDFEDFCFQQWCDLEDNLPKGLHYIFYIFYAPKPYSRFFNKPSQSKILNSILISKASLIIPILLQLIDIIKEVKESYFAIYDSSRSSEINAMTSHFNVFGWEDTIVSIAESKLFNGPEGPLKAVRDAKAYDVLNYLNLKIHRNLAEEIDRKSKTKNELD